MSVNLAAAYAAAGRGEEALDDFPPEDVSTGHYSSGSGGGSSRARSVSGGTVRAGVRATFVN